MLKGAMTPKTAAKWLAKESKHDSRDPALILGTKLADLLDLAATQGNGKRGDNAEAQAKELIKLLCGGSK